MIKTKRKPSYLYLIVILVPLLLYAVADVQTSRMVGFRDADRSNVYVYLALTMGLMIIYNIFRIHLTGYLKGILKYLWIMILWIFVINIFKSPDQWSSIIHISMGIWWVMSYLFFYTYKKHNYRSNKEIVSFFILMIGFYVYATIFSSINITTTFERDYAVLNYAYYLLTLSPFVFFIENKTIKNILLIIIVTMVVFSLKRGPIIILPLMLFANAYTEAKITNKKISGLMKYVVVSVFFVALLFYINNITNNFLFSRFSEEELQSGSGRADIYNHVLNDLSTRDFSELLTGSGSGSSVQLIGTGAHNEWLEFLYSFGIVGVLIYAIFCAYLIKRYFQLLKTKNNIAPIYGMVVVYVLLVGLFGGFYFVHSTFYVFSSLGFMEGVIYTRKKQRKLIMFIDKKRTSHSNK